MYMLKFGAKIMRHYAVYRTVRAVAQHVFYYVVLCQKKVAAAVLLGYVVDVVAVRAKPVDYVLKRGLGLYREAFDG